MILFIVGFWFFKLFLTLKIFFHYFCFCLHSQLTVLIDVRKPSEKQFIVWITLMCLEFIIFCTEWKPLTIITKRSILDATAVLDPPLGNFTFDFHLSISTSFN